MATVSKSELIKLQKSLGTDEAIGKKFKVTRQRTSLGKSTGLNRDIQNIQNATKKYFHFSEWEG
jgi:hypothetical protein